MESLAAALDDLFTKKKTHLKQPFFAAMLRPPLSAGPLLLPLLLAHAVRARSDYMRGQAAALLAAALKVRALRWQRFWVLLVAVSRYAVAREGVFLVWPLWLHLSASYILTTQPLSWIPLR